MCSSLNLKPLVTAVAALCVANMASAAGLGRSNQDVSAFLQDGTYAETVYTYTDADVTGEDIEGNKIDDIAEDYDYFLYGVKTDINDTFSIGVLYDEPWGAAADYDNSNIFGGAPNKVITGIEGIIQQYENGRDTLGRLQGAKSQYNAALSKGLPKAQVDQMIAGNEQLASAGITSYEALKRTISATEQTLEANKESYERVKDAKDAGVLDKALANTEGTNVEVRSESLTGLVGMKFGDKKQFQVYGGPVAQRIKADVSLRGDAYLSATGYDLNLNPDTDYGWIAGFQYSKPEIALKAALTYRSEIDHSMDVGEYMPLLALTGGKPRQVNKMEVTTPESVNFDFQTGINPTTLATAKVRWVPWSDFAVTPPLYNEATKKRYPEGLDLIDYDDDQWQVELGLAKRVADNLAISGTVGWDSGAGDPVTSLGPVEGYYSAGIGAKYNFNKNWAISAGGKYLWLGDADGIIPNGDDVSKFKDNNGFALGVRLSYQDK